ncbi:12-(S)-hydroxy-5,8,10,14-eicosatetraenoic acid receptor [Hippopotamus amphibius kiboko]|uniref:12-(S)-hydroxy-5,8,10,14-eicosatetraenoic acid receptor n=1 Tax=Hippopotamus amphibius kiboko TaxID=575201 RepID=UPI002592A6B4|nr:12-(S)-hydroxy-5,8,10,14-eicosatetraenoic acid receptor [Hippopotamus amphibius kiboko]
MLPPNCSVVHSHAVEAATAALLLLECALGALGNAVALWTFFFRLKVWKPYAVYLFNLVLADLLLATCLPFHAAFYLRRKTWGLGRTSCQVMLFLRAQCRGAGVAFLTAVTLDRYLRVVHSRLKVNLLSLRAAWGISVLVWLTMAALTHQSVFLSEAECPSSEPRMESSFSLIWQEALFFLQFILPFGLILFCSTGIIRTLQRRLRDPDKQPKLQRAQALVAVVVVLFTLCFLPSFLARVLLAIFQRTHTCGVLSAMVHAADVTGSLTYLQGVLNPVVYCFSNPTFRRSYRKLFYTLTLRGRKQEAEAPGYELRDSYS